MERCEGGEDQAGRSCSLVGEGCSKDLIEVRWMEVKRLYVSALWDLGADAWRVMLPMSSGKEATHV